MLFLSFRKRKNLDPTKCERHEKSIQNIITSVSTMLNPFDLVQNCLPSLASGSVVDDNVAGSLLGVEQIREDQFTSICQKQFDY